MLSPVVIAAFLIGVAFAALIGVILHKRDVARRKRAGESNLSTLRRAKLDLEGDLAVRTRDLKSAQLRSEGLTAQISANAAKFERALRGSSVVAFTNDTNLDLTWTSRPPVARSVGGNQPTLDPSDIGDPRVVDLKRQVLTTGQPARLEIQAPGERWYELELDAVRESGQIVGLMGVIVDITERREREHHIQLLLREVTHRSKNLLAVIQSMARQTAVHSGGASEFSNVFSQRIQSLAVSHDLLLKADWNGADIHRVVEAQLAPFADSVGGRIRVNGPALSLRPEAAQNLGMAIHELVTNAAKFGALSVPAGTVEVAWRIVERQDKDSTSPSLEFEWRERGNPSASAERRRGFGHVVLESATARSLAGRSFFSYAQDGVTWTLVISARDWVQETPQPRVQRR